jgi:hypothetical protein
MKECLDCLETKPLSEFYKDKRRKDNHGIYCKSCWGKRYTSSDEQVAARRLAVKRHWDKKSDLPEFKHQRRVNQLKYLYGLSLEAFQEMLLEQGGKCGICEVLFTDTTKPHVDHDHACCLGNRSCGQCVRQLLCKNCNRMIGLCNDNIDTLERAARYLRRYSKFTTHKD